MRLEFQGAARTVTGSRYLLSVPGTRVLVDCGLYQGVDEERNRDQANFPFDPSEIDFVLLTHAHIDHCGLLPRLSKLGFRGKVFATSATRDLCEALLADSAHIQDEDARWEMRKWRRGQQNTPPPAPLYTIEDVDRVMDQFESLSYGDDVQVAPGLSARWQDAGHILGAASLEVWATESGVSRKIVFSGDIGSPGRPILRDPTLLDSADFVVIESTYGDRLHPGEEDIYAGLERAVNRMVREKGQMIVPAFAVGRTQELLYRLDRLMALERIPRVPVFVDSPLARKATEVFAEHEECYDTEALELLARGDDPISFPTLKFTGSMDESKKLNDLREPAIIIAASGMCTAGRIRHHLHQRLERGNNTILFVGYQAEGTLGRIILSGAQKVKLFGRWHRVRARIRQVQGLSAHADQQDLLNWATHIRDPRAIFVNHGEPHSAFTLARLLSKQVGVPVSVPRMGDTVDLLSAQDVTALAAATTDEMGPMLRRGPHPGEQMDDEH